MQQAHIALLTNGNRTPFYCRLEAKSGSQMWYMIDSIHSSMYLLLQPLLVRGEASVGVASKAHRVHRRMMMNRSKHRTAFFRGALASSCVSTGIGWHANDMST